MSNRTIIQRLRLTLGLLIALSIFGSFLLVGVEKQISRTRSDAYEAVLVAQHLRYDILQVISIVRGLLLDPKNEQEARHRQETNNSLHETIAQARVQFGSRPRTDQRRLGSRQLREPEHGLLAQPPHAASRHRPA